MIEEQRRTQVLEAEQAVRLLAKSLAGSNASKKEFDTLTAILSAAANSVTAATADLGHLRHLVASEHEQAGVAIAGTVAQAKTSLEFATERLTELGGQAVALAASEATNAGQRMTEITESVGLATARLDTRLNKIDQVIPALQKALTDRLVKTSSDIHTDVTDSTKRMLETVCWAEESLRKQTVASATESTPRLSLGDDRIEKAVAAQTTASTNRIEKAVSNQAAISTSELRRALDAGVQMVLERLAQAQQEIRLSAEVEHKRGRTLLFSLCFVEGAVLIGIVLLLWRHW